MFPTSMPATCTSSHFYPHAFIDWNRLPTTVKIVQPHLGHFIFFIRHCTFLKEEIRTLKKQQDGDSIAPD